MTRNCKIIGLSLAVAFTMSTMAVTAAWAQTNGKLTIAGPAQATLDVTEAGANNLTVFSGEVECPVSIMKGHKANTTPHSLVPANASEITLNPFVVTCNNSPGKPRVTVTPHNCDLTGKIGETTGGVANTYGIALSLECNAPNDTITFERYAFSGSELGGVQCTVQVKAQSDLTEAHLSTDAINDDFKIEGTVGMLGERSGACMTGTEGITQHLSLTVKGTDENGKGVGITVTH